MSKYYVSAAGCDCNDGLTPETSWKSVAKVNESIAGGDTVYFRCGDTFFGQLVPPKAENPYQPTTYTSYGCGAKPELSVYKIPHADAWERESDNIWKLNLNDTSRYDGNTSQLDCNVGFIKASGQIYPHKCFALEDLKAAWDFVNIETYVYVYAEKNPAELSDDIRIACNIHCIVFGDNMKMDGLIVRGTGAHGLCGIARGAHIVNCEFHEIGGSELYGFPVPHVRYGNAIECAINSHDVLVEHCKFSGVYDVAVTMQGEYIEVNWENIHFRNNVMWNNQHCFEIWTRRNNPNTGFINCSFENNLCIGAGYGWSYSVRPDKEASTHLLLYDIVCDICDITVTGNTFVNARNMTLFESEGIPKIPKGYRVFGNTIICREGQLLAWNGNCTPEEHKAYEEKLCAENRVYRHSAYTLPQ